MQSTATATAPGLGGAGLQLRGLPTRHTLVLTDGLPLLGAEPDSAGVPTGKSPSVARRRDWLEACRGCARGAVTGDLTNI